MMHTCGLLPIVIELYKCQSAMSMNAFDHCFLSLCNSRKKAKYGAFVGHIRSMNNMLFQHHNTCSPLRTRSIIVCMLWAKEVVTSKISGMATEKNAVARLLRTY